MSHHRNRSPKFAQIRRGSASLALATRYFAYIAAHRYHREEAGPYLLLVQRTLAEFGARPHWGKMHWLGARELSRLYPRFEDFRAVRRAADPDGQLMTPALRHLLGA